MISVRRVTDPNDPAITSFGRLQRAVYFAPETLIPGEYIGSMLGGPTGERMNVFLVAEADGRVIGGALFHAFAATRTGFSSFLGVARDWRGHGVARRLHAARLEALEQVLNGPIHGVFIDVVNPSRQPANELEREVAVGSDPCGRRRAFQRLGFRQVDIRYEQPVGGPGGGPVTVLDLLYCPRSPATSVSTTLVAETMRQYWSPWLGPARARRHADELRLRSGGSSDLALLPADADCPS
jgi:GNAT superfamily N-acetyltransferase